ncbi:nuclear transport factor 2 family protein [Pseudonocardia sp. NPDC049635]|uniref:nuclear transport factor 2 family protein n=1 Tax=Pseudonocardia sp. NPDC049635 TaxID=3155506 RepID=UPI0033E24D0D
MTSSTTDLAGATRAFYAEVDANDPQVFQKRLIPNAVFAFNDVDPVTGPEAITEFVGSWKGNFRSVTHELGPLTIDTTNNRVGVEIVVSYVFPDGHEVKVKGCSFLDFDGDSLSGWRVYVDTSRLT